MNDPAIPTKPEISQEIEKNPETIETLAAVDIPKNTPQDDKTKDDDKKDIPIDTALAEPPEKVVDKSEKITQLHSIQTDDSLTTLADQEEEEFIRKVEAAHDEQHN